mgnify:CR=1 FL=1
MSLGTRQQGKAVIFDLEGKLALGPAVDDFRAGWSDALAAGSRYVVVNLANVPVIDSSGIGILVRCHAAVAAWTILAWKASMYSASGAGTTGSSCQASIVAVTGPEWVWVALMRADAPSRAAPCYQAEALAAQLSDRGPSLTAATLPRCVPLP